MKIERTSKGGLKVIKTVKAPRKRRIDVTTLVVDLPSISTDELKAMEMFFMIHSFYDQNNDFHVPDMREACKFCIQELIHRGIYEESDLPNWKEGSNELSR